MFGPIDSRAAGTAASGRIPDQRYPPAAMALPSALRSPRLLFSHLLVLTLVVVMINLGLWQLRRLDEVNAVNDRLETRLAAQPVALRSLQIPDDRGDPATGELEFVPVRATGTYLPEHEVLQRGRSHSGRSGFHVLTPLDLGDDRSVLVRRGWVPFDLDEPPVPEALPPQGTVTVTGFLERSIAQPSGFGQRDPDGGPLERVFHADTVRLDQQIPGRLLPLLVHLEEQSPPQPGALPVPADRPTFAAGTHLSYAIQWFAFAAIAAIAYGAWLYRRGTRIAAP